MKGLSFAALVCITRICFWVLLGFVEPQNTLQSSTERHRQVLLFSAFSENLVWLLIHTVIGWDQGQLSKEAVLKVVESYTLYRVVTFVLTRWVARPISALRRYSIVDDSIVERNGNLYRLECVPSCVTGRTIPEYITRGNVSPSGWIQYDEMASLGWDRYVARSVRRYFEERHLAQGYIRDQIEVMPRFVSKVRSDSETGDDSVIFDLDRQPLPLPQPVGPGFLLHKENKRKI